MTLRLLPARTAVNDAYYHIAMGAHISEAGLRFLRGLKRNNDRDWFNQRKSIYEQEMKEPLLAIIQEINEAMLRFAPDHVRSPAKTMMRIYRDIRFAQDKRPYKTHVSAWWARNGMEKTSGGGFYIQIAADQVQIAAGVFMPEKAQLLAIRQHIVLHHLRLRSELKSRRLQTLGLAPMAGKPLTRPPKGFSEPGEGSDLLRLREWGVGGTFPVAMALAPNFSREIARRFERATPLVHLLNEPLLLRQKPASFVPMPLHV